MAMADQELNEAALIEAMTNIRSFESEADIKAQAKPKKLLLLPWQLRKFFGWSAKDVADAGLMMRLRRNDRLASLQARWNHRIGRKRR